MAGTKQWRAADGRLQPGFQTAGFTLKQVGKLQALGAQTLYFEHEKRYKPGILDFLSDTASG